MKIQQLRELPHDNAAVGIAQKLRVMTYNVLAQCYVRSTLFPYCKSSELRWKCRSKKLEAVFASSLPASPDVICLQEVDNYGSFWSNMMRKFGYQGIFIKKTCAKLDGVAVFWNAKKLKVKDVKRVNLDLPNEDEWDIDIKLRKRASTRGSVGVIVHFEHLDMPLDFIVATTHLFWDPMQEDVKLLQTRRMLRMLDIFTSMMDTSMPLIFAGDFNSLPDSKVYNFITSNNNFKSAYAQYDSTGEPPFTNVNGEAITDDGEHVPRFVGTLDYIFYRSPRIQPTGLMELMSFEEASKHIALPSAISPSDHLPLMCEFLVFM